MAQACDSWTFGHNAPMQKTKGNAALSSACSAVLSQYPDDDRRWPRQMSYVRIANVGKIDIPTRRRFPAVSR